MSQYNHNIYRHMMLLPCNFSFLPPLYIIRNQRLKTNTPISNVSNIYIHCLHQYLVSQARDFESCS